jgi:hypothetical protein
MTTILYGTLVCSAIIAAMLYSWFHNSSLDDKIGRIVRLRTNRFTSPLYRVLYGLARYGQNRTLIATVTTIPVLVILLAIGSVAYADYTTGIRNANGAYLFVFLSSIFGTTVIIENVRHNLGSLAAELIDNPEAPTPTPLWPLIQLLSFWILIAVLDAGRHFCSWFGRWKYYLL